MDFMESLPFWSAFPFVGLLLAIAILPLAWSHFWEDHRNKAIVAILFSLPVLWLFLRREPHAILHTLIEYSSFICLLGSLFTISGGILLRGDLQATPKVNTIFLGVGAILANLIGTTGASMVLIRAFLKTNSERRRSAHLPVFFTIVVCNCGGLLTPLGDPPLFLGYLRGVPFFWTLKLFPIWLLTISLILTIFYFWDRRAYRQERPQDLRLDRTRVQPLRLSGWSNFFFLGGVLYSVFLKSPWRELLMIHMALLSLFVGPKTPRHENRFHWGPIIEVAILFLGIFITMVPALELLRGYAPQLGISRPWHFFWLTGSLSSFLDNAPTYLTFLTLAQGLGLTGDVVGVPTRILQAISTGAVFMGANSYIGNGPNFMVKAIADHSGCKTPSFFGYMLYAFVILFPLYLIVTLIFFWG